MYVLSFDTENQFQWNFWSSTSSHFSPRYASSIKVIFCVFLMMCFKDPQDIWRHILSPIKISTLFQTILWSSNYPQFQTTHRVTRKVVRSSFILFSPLMPPHVHTNFRGPPSWLWRKCNRLLMLGRPWGAVTLSRRCEGWYLGRWTEIVKSDNV